MGYSTPAVLVWEVKKTGPGVTVLWKGGCWRHRGKGGTLTECALSGLEWSGLKEDRTGSRRPLSHVDVPGAWGRQGWVGRALCDRIAP